MKLLKPVRIALWVAGGLAVAVLGLYLLRWPLLEGTVRAKVSALVGQELHAKSEIGSLHGSLIHSITARDVVLRPGANAPFRSATADRITVTYGFLGSGEPSLSIDGVHVVLASKEGPAPPLHETIRDVVSVLRSLRFPGSVEARKSDVTLPDGQVLSLREARLDHGVWSLTLETEGFGKVEGAASLGEDGTFRFEGKAAEGPVRSARIELGGGSERCPLSISTELLGRALTWTGTASFEKERLVRAEGSLSMKEGKANTVVDFRTGRVEADADGVLPVDQEFKGDLALSGHAEGPIAGPPEAWTLREGSVRTKGARLRDRPIDEAVVTLGRGTLAEIGFDAKARSGEDRVEAEGRFRWKKQADVDATVRASIADVAPWLTLLPEPPGVKARQVRVDGKVGLHEGAVSFDGSVAAGPGAFEQTVTWDKVELKGSYDAGRVELRESLVTGTPWAPSIAATGKYDGETVLLRLKAGSDELDVGGRLQKNGDFEGRIRVEGPLDWLGVREAVKPYTLRPFSIAGKVQRVKDDFRVLLEVAMEKEFEISPVASIRKNGDEWWVALAPGTATLPRGRVDYSEVLLKAAPGRVSLNNLKLASTDPDLVVRLSGSVAWDEKETRITFVAADTVFRKTPIDTLVARVAIDKASGEIVPNLRWGKEDGDHLRVTGRWGKDADLRIDAMAHDLNRPLLRLFLPSVGLEGGVSIDAHVTGSSKEPKLAGTIGLHRITTAGLPPLSLVIPVTVEGDTLKVWASEDDTPYGRVEVEGTVPLSGGDTPMDVALRISTRNFAPLLDQLKPQTRPWIPQGDLRATISIQGPPGKLHLGGRAEFYSASFFPPHPLPEATSLRVWARLDDDGVVVEAADGLMGRGPFWATGRWDLFRPGRPLELWVTGQNVLVVDDPLTRLRVTPDALLTWKEGGSLKLTGRLEVPLAIWHREFSANTPGGNRSASRQLATPRLRLIPAESGGFLIPGIEGLEALELALKVKSTGEIRIENSVIGILVGVEGSLGGTATDPALSGVIRSRPKRGEVKLAPGNFMRIESAEAYLPEEPGGTPTVRFHGRVGTGEGAIQVLVNGPTDSPNLVLQSDPPLPQKELLAKLAFGLGTGSIKGETGAATLALYLYDQYQDAWPDADRKESFFNRIRPQVIAGEEAKERRVPWELPPSGTLKSTSLRTEYVYNAYFSIIGETNREGDVGGDLKLRIRF